MDNEELIAVIRVEQNKIAAQLLKANPQWRELQGAINALRGVYVIPEEPSTAGALEAQEARKDGATEEGATT